MDPTCLCIAKHLLIFIGCLRNKLSGLLRNLTQSNTFQPRRKPNRQISGAKTVQTSPISLPSFAWFGLCKPTANKMDQTPNQFFRHPNQNVSYPNHFSQIANLHANQLPRHPNRHSIPCKPFANRCQTRPGVGNPCQPEPIFSNDGYNSLVSCGLLDDQ